MTQNPTLPALTLLGDMLEEKEAELSINGTEESIQNLNELWELYHDLID